MKFNEVDFAKVPAFDQFARRLKALHPTFVSVKAGKEFDVDIYRIYVKEANSPRLPVDISEYLLQNLDQNSHSCESSYTMGLITQLDNVIQTALGS